MTIEPILIRRARSGQKKVAHLTTWSSFGVPISRREIPKVTSTFKNRSNGFRWNSSDAFSSARSDACIQLVSDVSSPLRRFRPSPSRRIRRDLIVVHHSDNAVIASAAGIPGLEGLAIRFSD